MAQNGESFCLYDNVYRGSKKINIKNSFDEYRSIIEKSEFKDYFKVKEDLTERMRLVGEKVVEKESYDILADYCDPKHLTVKGEVEKLTKYSFEWCKDPMDPSVLDDIKLKTYICTKKRNSMKAYKKPLKYRSEKPVCYESTGTKVKSSPVTPLQDILVYVRVYLPYSSRSKQISGAMQKLSINYVIAILGSQTLDMLRDKINCISDLSISRESSRRPIRGSSQNAKDVYKSGFFFIEGTFYNDFRDPNNKDLSQVLRNWSAAKGFGTPKTAKMEETRVDSLTTKFGFPWVYQHQGDCEHLIVFSDATLINPADELDITCYPRVVRIRPQQSRYCMTCGIYSVNWVTIDNNRVPHNPCFFCDSCFKSYNYVSGTKIGDFKAYPYPTDNVLLQNEYVQSCNSMQENLRPWERASNSLELKKRTKKKTKRTRKSSDSSSDLST